MVRRSPEHKNDNTVPEKQSVLKNGKGKFEMYRQQLRAILGLERINLDVTILFGTEADEIDEIANRQGNEMTFISAARESRIRVLAEAALERIKNGTYGKCTICNDNIPAARLQVLPFAPCCRECQEQEDNNPTSEQEERNDSVAA
ncbi:hypothetical protein A2635_05770 [Candidatus Peribacteria bacterium RIFCSPHIGHO2_01_FULL_51_9]|nr:MAG: hypothetical protein A2635_05770 [Candidatus Peribacteria bacterium RIFCSPHIGHO2_01_FULL_51_9]